MSPCMVFYLPEIVTVRLNLLLLSPFKTSNTVTETKDAWDTEETGLLH